MNIKNCCDDCTCTIINNVPESRKMGSPRKKEHCKCKQGEMIVGVVLLFNKRFYDTC